MRESYQNTILNMKLLGSLYVQTESRFNNRTELRLIILRQDRGKKAWSWQMEKSYRETKANSDSVKGTNSAYFSVVELIHTSHSQSQQVTFIRNPPKTHIYSYF